MTSDLLEENQDLRKEITELKNKLEHRNCLDCSNHSSNLRMRNLELEKENAKLKEENQKWKDEWQEQVQEATEEGYARTLQTIQLNKAKKIIHKFCYEYGIYDKDFVEEVKQFLNSEVKK